MNDNSNNSKRKALKARIKSCDPFVAKTLADYYEGLLEKEEGGLNTIELGVKVSIEKFCKDSVQVEKREFNGVINAVNSVLDKKDTEEWSAHETAFLTKLEEIVFLKLNRSNKISELDQIDKYVESLLKLDYPKMLPTFKLANNKRNIFNYFSLSLESISEKIKESTISAKAVNNMMQYMPESTMVVTDNQWNIRFVGSGKCDLFDKEATLMIDEILTDYIVNPEILLKELKNSTYVTEFPIRIKKNLHSNKVVDSFISIIPNETESYANGEQDEIEEYVIKIDCKAVKSSSVDHSVNGSITAGEELIQEMKKSLPEMKSRVDEAEWLILNKCLEELLELKSKRQNLLADEEANYSGGVVAQKELIDITALVKTIAKDLESFAGFEEVVLVLQNKKASPFNGYYDMVYSVLRHVITMAVKFRKSNNAVNEVSILVRDIDDHTSIQVKDNGVGLPEVWLTKIFDEDFLASDDKDKKALTNGLHFVKKTVERMNGQIELFSTPNEGSTFTILLPR